MTHNPLVSIIIRARDEEPALRRLIPLLQRQQTDFAFEIWLLDNDSHDGSAALAQQYGLEYHRIPRNYFNYSAALNQGAALAHGEYIVSLSAHCFPQSARWLSALIEPLRRDELVVATYGRQWHNPANGPFEALMNDILFPAETDEPEIVAFSNANSAVRRSVLLRHPFNTAVKILEDQLFYLELASEYRFVYVPAALVHHEHDHFSWSYYLRRWEREGWAYFFLTQHRGYTTPIAPKQLLSIHNLLLVYPRLAGHFLKRLRPGTALLTLPFFWLRDLTILASFLRAQRLHPRIAQEDTTFLLNANRSLLHSNEATPNAPAGWSEEWQLKADWPFIRRNIAAFIRRCHEQGLVHNPLLEIGASGQNDWLAEFYTMQTSNLAENMQGAALELDMEDMRRFADQTIGSILCSEVIEHVRHPERAIAESFRVLQPGGTLIITTPYSIVIHNTPDDGGFHGRNFTPQGLELLLREAGFEIVLIETRGATATRRTLMPSNVFAVGRKPQNPAHNG